MTKKDVEWREEVLFGATEPIVLDVNDKFKWEEATLFKRQTFIEKDREVEKGYFGFRVYRNVGTKLKLDAEGRTFDGWSEKFDEWIPLYSPRIQPHCTQHGIYAKTIVDSSMFDYENTIDDMIKPGPGQTRVYQVPRPSTCLSEKFLEMMNLFGNEGGFDMLIEVLQNVQPGEAITMDSICYISSMFSMSVSLWHKEWISEYAPVFVAAVRGQFENSNDQILRTMNEDAYKQGVRSIFSIHARNADKDEVAQL